MYFESSKKTYRFPSTNLSLDFDTKFYFPEKSQNVEDTIRNHNSFHQLHDKDMSLRS
ncbi:MAG: hypothetical protein K0S47_2553 [Herbinix sp.]|jgi:hypothetical protein|nr:hypothetical protein [Herbinix sp.]